MLPHIGVVVMSDKESPKIGAVTEPDVMELCYGRQVPGSRTVGAINSLL